MLMMPRRFAFILVACVTLLTQGYVLLTWHTFWELYPGADSILHALWGMSIFLFLLDVGRWRVRDAMLGVIVLQMWWEAGEIIGNKLVPWDHEDNFFWDGAKDTLMNIAGAAVGMFAMLLRPGKTNLRRPWFSRALVVNVLRSVPVLVPGRGVRQDRAQTPSTSLGSRLRHSLRYCASRFAPVTH